MRRESTGVTSPSRPLGPTVVWDEPWTPEFVVERLEPLVVPDRQARIRGVLGQRLSSVTVLLDAPHDPHNGAAVLRSCDAFGIQTLHVVPRLEPFLVAGCVAKGTERWVDVFHHPNAGAAARSLVEHGFELVATHPEGELVPEDLLQIPRLCLVLGNERDGIGEDLRQAADRTVRIPMRGFVQSLNLSVSAAILLSAATRGRPGDLTPCERELLYARGLLRTVARAREILGLFARGA